MQLLEAKENLDSRGRNAKLILENESLKSTMRLHI